MIRDSVAAIILKSVVSLREAGGFLPVEIPAIEVERPQMATHGDYSTNIAMKLAAAIRSGGAAKANPRELAEAIAAQMRETVAVVPAYHLISAVEVAGPGFINIRLRPSWLLDQAAASLAAGAAFGAIDVGKGTRVNLEFVSANPTGPVTVGNGRGAFIGDVVANAMRAAGYTVTKEYYFNDTGEQMNKLGRSMEYYLLLAKGDTTAAEAVYAQLPAARKYQGDKSKYKAKTSEPAPEDAEQVEQVEQSAQSDAQERDPDATSAAKEGYFGAYYEVIAARMLERGQDGLLARPPTERPQAIGQAAAGVIMEDIRQTMANMGVAFGVWFNQASLETSGALLESIDVLRSLGFVEEKDGALWAKTSTFGDDFDRVVLKRDGQPTYFASDVAYMRDKFDRGFDRLIIVLGPDHHGYIGRLKAIAGVLGRNPEDVHILLYQQVNIKKDGKSVRMGKRLGNIVTLDELYDDVGVDVTRFFYLMRSNDTHLDFDLNLALKQTEENPGLSVQYAHARASGVFRKAAEQGYTPADYAQASVGVLVNDPPEELDYELALIRQMLRLEEVVERIATTLEPHHLTRYASDLADAFHLFYDHCPILKQGKEIATETRLARLRLLRAAQAGLARSLALLGMSAPERMEREEASAI